MTEAKGLITEEKLKQLPDISTEAMAVAFQNLEQRVRVIATLKQITEEEIIKDNVVATVRPLDDVTQPFVPIIDSIAKTTLVEYIAKTSALFHKNYNQYDKEQIHITELNNLITLIEEQQKKEKERQQKEKEQPSEEDKIVDEGKTIIGSVLDTMGLADNDFLKEISKKAGGVLDGLENLGYIADIIDNSDDERLEDTSRFAAKLYAAWEMGKIAAPYVAHAAGTLLIVSNPLAAAAVIGKIFLISYAVDKLSGLAGDAVANVVGGIKNGIDDMLNPKSRPRTMYFPGPFGVDGPMTPKARNRKYYEKNFPWLVDLVQTFPFLEDIFPFLDGLGDDDFVLPSFDDDFNNAGSTPNVDPLVLDLSGDGFKPTTLDKGVHFDLDGNGFAERINWIQGDDALLVLDKNGDGTVNDGNELFGDRYRLANGQLAKFGFEALLEQDSNGDKVIDDKDENFSRLQVWQDANQNGISEKEELRSLSQAEIAAIQLNYEKSKLASQEEVTFGNSAKFIKANGETGGATEYWVKKRGYDTKMLKDVDIPLDVMFLPNVAGSGNLPSLHQAMAMDEGLVA